MKTINTEEKIWYAEELHESGAAEVIAECPPDSWKVTYKNEELMHGVTIDGEHGVCIQTESGAVLYPPDIPDDYGRPLFHAPEPGTVCTADDVQIPEGGRLGYITNGDPDTGDQRWIPIEP